MSHYKVKAIHRKKDGTITVCAADSSLRPLSYQTCKYHGTLADLLHSINDGNFQLHNSQVNEPYIEVEKAIDKLIKIGLTDRGLTLDVAYKYKIQDRADAIQFLCEEFAKVLESGDIENLEDPGAFGKMLADGVAERTEAALQKIEDIKAADEQNNIVRISCAAKSIFEGLDLLYPCDTNDGFILAPEKDYSNNGILQTEKENIISLGKESNDLYAYLSFDGVGFTMTELLEKCPDQTDNYLSKFKRVDVCVKRALEGGAKMKEGVTPYRGYTIQTSAA